MLVSVVCIKSEFNTLCIFIFKICIKIRIDTCIGVTKFGSLTVQNTIRVTYELVPLKGDSLSPDQMPECSIHFQRIVKQKANWTLQATAVVGLWECLKEIQAYTGLPAAQVASYMSTVILRAF